MQRVSQAKTGINTMPRLLSTGQAAIYLGVDSSTVRRRIYAGDIPVIRCFKHFKIDRVDLDAFIEAQKDVL
jgi:excisionase family DNA binding protein